MQKDYRIYLDDVLEAIEKIQDYIEKISYEQFSKNGMISDAVIRNLEVIGEAVKSLPTEIKNKHPNIEWRKISGLRDILIHEYFGINLKIVWDIVINKIPELKKSIIKIKKEKS